MREYLDGIPGQAGKPIWVTEVGLYWGFDGLAIIPDGQGGYLFLGTGEYHQAEVLDYLTTVFDWLEANSATMNIQRWFLFASYADLVTPNASASAGLTLFDAPGVGAALTPTGELFRSRALGLE